MKNVLLIIATLFLLTNCTQKKENTAKSNASHFCIPDSLMSQVKTEDASLQQVYSDLKLTGQVTFDQDKVVHIYPMVSGIVEEVKVTLGTFVKKGQVLAVIRSSEVANTQNDLISARSNLAIAQKNYEANADMYKSGILSEREFLTSQKELEKAKSEVSRVRTASSIYGGSGSGMKYVVRAPISGFVVEKFVNANMQIRPDNSTNLFTISDLKKVWVVANVYESDIATVRENETAEVTTLSYPDKRFQGHIDKIYDMLDPDTKTMKVKIQLDNPGYLLKPEMFATALLHHTSSDKMLAIPANAVIFDKNQYWVLVYHNRCNIEIRKVDIASSNSETSYIHSGVKDGEKVVTNNQLLIYNAISQ
ncbi:MAG: efflux RND transporter periplasmic adaptor subunit [Paludibacteraceae bacterium]|nr:efflux RND transporter periplasmic adaptor subunit [Paludibacteraceae bacterium]